MKVLSLVVKWMGCESDHSPTSSADVKKEWNCTFTPLYVSMAWSLDKHQGKLHLNFKNEATNSMELNPP
jgi:hypothetical protein